MCMGALVACMSVYMYSWYPERLEEEADPVIRVTDYFKPLCEC